MTHEQALSKINAAIETEERTLDLSGLGLEHIPEEISGIRSLRTLILDDNHISDLEPLINIHGLERLKVSNNQIKDLSPLADLVNLKFLILDYNQIEDIGVLKKLINLEKLACEYNPITNVTVLANFINIKVVSCIGCPIESLQPFLDELKRTDKVLEHFETFDLATTWLEEITLDLFDRLPNLETMYLNDTRIKNIPAEIFQKVANICQAVKGYLKSMGDERRKVVDKVVRVILVGNSNAGKTTFAHFLDKGIYRDNIFSTHGIIHFRWNVPHTSVVADLWDFGGQEYYHNTHRLFFRKDCLYLLLWTADSNYNGHKNVIRFDKNEEHPNGHREFEQVEIFNYGYWLSNISYFLRTREDETEEFSEKASNYAPIMILQNKSDLHPRAIIPSEHFRKFDLNPSHVFYISPYRASINEKNEPVTVWKHEWNYFTKHLELKLKELYNGRKKIPEFYITVREHIKENWRGVVYLKKDKLINDIKYELKDDPGVSQIIDDSEIEGMLNYLDSTGFLLYYSKIRTLNEMIFLQPEWVSAKIYDILENGLRFKRDYFNEGEFDRAHIVKKLGVDDHLTDVFIELLGAHQFELIFKTQRNGKQLFVAPQYLSEDIDQNDLFWRSKDTEHVLTICYPEFTPKSLMSRIIVEFADGNANSSYWKNGISYSYHRHSVFIQLKNGQDTGDDSLEPQKYQFEISISKDATTEEKSRILKSILDFCTNSSRSELNELQFSFDKVSFLEVGKLLDAIANGARSVNTTQMKTFPIDNDMKGILKTYVNVIEPGPKVRPNIFISYSHRDALVKDDLLKHLSRVAEQSIIWHDKAISPGNEFDAEIHKNLSQADIILFLISPNFLSSSYIRNREYKIAKERHRVGQAIIVPVLLDHCDWEEDHLPADELRINFLEALPKDANGMLKPLIQWSKDNGDYSLAGKDIARSVGRIVQQIIETKKQF